jgi:hypothetical protein
MSPFRSSKNNITSSSSSVRAVEGRDTLGASVGRNNAFETWTYGNYKYYSFTDDGFFEILRSGPIDVAIIGGGGAGGGDDNGGGGGAGAFVENYNVTFPIGKYDVFIGRGGIGTRSAYFATAGGASKLVGPSNFTDITAVGGAYGAGSSNTAGPPGTGSGGGGSPYSGKSNATDLAHGSPGGGAKQAGGGGGGGAGSVGSLYDPSNVLISPPVTNPIGSPSNLGMMGGHGKAMFGGDLGIPENYGYNTPNTPYAANGRHFAGGGGGGDTPGASYNGYLRNPGGGGAVAGSGPWKLIDSPSRHIYDGDPNTGSGGSGGSGGYVSGNGGSGILIIRIPIVFAE